MKLIFLIIQICFAQAKIPLNLPESLPTNSSSIKELFYEIKYPLTGYLKGRICSAPGTKNWTTSAGYFRQSTYDLPTKCGPGFWCPSNTFEPVYCCAGFYCPQPAQISICPKGMYCPMGSVIPQNCWGLSTCDEGTIKPLRIGMLGVIGAVLLLVAFEFHLKSRIETATAVKNNHRIQRAHQERVDGVVEIPLSPTKKHDKAIDISFENLEFILPDGTVIMRNTSGSIKSGKTTAIMGPSGAGKSTLFSLLTGKSKRSKGVLKLNGVEDELSHYKKLVGVVPQDDIMLKELSVNDILTHSANMRLPTNLASDAKIKQVIQTIEFLGLGHIINTPIGDEEQRGISGGQRKRVNIGMEIVADPAVLFLDEPTSGLDSSTSLQLCQLLSRLARENKMAIAAVIHSPSPQTFFEFDHVLFLCKGGMVAYFGPTSDIAAYFKGLGFECGDNINPCDFAMDVVSGNIPCKWDPKFEPSFLPDFWKTHKNGKPADKVVKDAVLNRALTSLLHSEREETTTTKVLSSLLAIAVDIEEWVKDVVYEGVDTCYANYYFVTRTKDPVRTTPNVFVCYLLLFKRAFNQQYRSARVFIFDSVIHFIAGLVISSAIQSFDYLGRQPKEVCNLTPVMLVIACETPIDFLNYAGMLASIGVLFAGQATGSTTFGSEKIVYWRDSSAGMPTLPYFLAKLTADLPRIALASFFFTLAMTVFVDYRSNFGDLMLIFLALYYVSFNFGYFISIIFNKKSVALVTATNALLQGFVFAGVAPDLVNDVYSTNPSKSYAPFQWLWEISGPRWAVEAYYIKEARARPWAELQVDSGMPLLRVYGNDTFTDCIGMMIKIGSMWAFFSFLALKLTNRRKQK